MPTPIPIPLETGGLVLFGGSFDPPHRAHLLFARFLLDHLAGASLVLVPAARSPHKHAGPTAAPDQRIEMLKLGLGDVGLAGSGADACLPPRVGIWTDELDRAAEGEPSYWVDTLRRARDLLSSSVSLRFVIGSDQVAEFHRWREPHEVLRLAWPIVLVRGGGSVEDGSIVDSADAARIVNSLHPEGAWSEGERAMFLAGVLIGQPTMAVASTLIRAHLESDPDTPDLEQWLTPSVLSFIRRGGLYRDRV